MFCLNSGKQGATEYKSHISFDSYCLCYSEDTPVDKACLLDRELLIFGYSVDLLDGVGEDVALKVLKHTKTLQDVIAFESHLGGKYLLFYKDADGCYAIPDATASVPLCYIVEGADLMCASDPEQIARSLSLEPDSKLLRIRNSGDLSQAMPFDLTVYKEIRQLLPNHYLSFGERKAIRMVNAAAKTPVLTPKQAADQTAPLIENLLRYYKKRFKLYCPITSGWDSRVVLSMMLAQGENIETYTIKHNHFLDQEPDVLIPKQLENCVPITNAQIPDIEIPDEMRDAFCQYFGSTGFSARTLMIANTIKSFYSDGAVVNGDIIGQVGKCSLHRDIPKVLASARYFRCKLHNYSKCATNYLNDWINEIRSVGEQTNLFDLFSLESRMGRWAAQENLIYAMVGQKYLNIFNSRSIIYPWTCVSRKDRKLSKIHRELILQSYPELMQVAVGGRMPAIERMSKLNGLTYYVASFVKFYFEKFRFIFKR